MRTISKASLIPFPDTDIQENFSFDAITDEGNFTFKFRWFNNRWNCWVTLPDESIKEIGVYPNVLSGSGRTDYGFIFITDMASIDYNSLFLTELCLVVWD